MIPGTTTKLSETTVASAAAINAKSDIVKITGSTQINTIQPNFMGGFSGIVFLVPVDGAITLGTSGNILVGFPLVQNRATMLVYVKSLAKWIIAT